MISSEKVLWAMAQKVVFTCAMCDNFWWGVECGTGGCKSQSTGTGCTGPLGASDFPEYEGALKDVLQDWCFVCGQRSTHVAEPHGKRPIGVCEGHIEVLKNFSLNGVAPPVLRPISVDVRQ